MRSMCADAGCLAMNYQSLSNPEIRKQLSAGGASPSLSFMPAPSFFEDGAGIHTTSSLGPLGFEGAQHRQTLRPSVDGVRSKALRPFGLQYGIHTREREIFIDSLPVRVH